MNDAIIIFIVGTMYIIIKTVELNLLSVLTSIFLPKFLRLPVQKLYLSHLLFFFKTHKLYPDFNVIGRNVIILFTLVVQCTRK